MENNFILKMLSLLNMEMPTLPELESIKKKFYISVNYC